MAVRMLLLQARRSADPMREHEHRCFVSRAGLPAANVIPHDLCDGPPSPASLSRYDALTVGGSGEYYVSRGNLPDAQRGAINSRTSCGSSSISAKKLASKGCLDTAADSTGALPSRATAAASFSTWRRLPRDLLIRCPSSDRPGAAPLRSW